jgi:hypothetical protein
MYFLKHVRMHSPFIYKLQVSWQVCIARLVHKLQVQKKKNDHLLHFFLKLFIASILST